LLWITYVYDALNRLNKKQYPDSTEVDYVYDLVGKIQSVNDPTRTFQPGYRVGGPFNDLHINDTTVGSGAIELALHIDIGIPTTDFSG
jgi:YD repeat-containing protein